MVSPSRGLLFSSLGSPCPPGPPPCSSPDHLPSQPSVPTPCPRRPHHRLPQGRRCPLPVSLVTKEPTRDWCPHHSERLSHALPAARSTRRVGAAPGPSSDVRAPPTHRTVLSPWRGPGS